MVRWEYGWYGGSRDGTVGVRVVRFKYGWYGGSTDGMVEVWMVRWKYGWYGGSTDGTVEVGMVHSFLYKNIFNKNMRLKIAKNLRTC